MSLYCNNCGSRKAAIVNNKRNFNYRGKTITIPIKESWCENCDAREVLDTKEIIEQKLKEKYLTLYNDFIFTKDQVKFIRNNKGLSKIEFDKELGFFKGTTKAVESGAYILKEEETEKIKQWLEQNS